MKKLIPGCIGSSIMEVKYGQAFPKVGEERRLRNEQGSFTCKIVQVGVPRWTPKMTVRVPTRIEILEVHDLTIKEKARQSTFSLVKD